MKNILVFFLLCINSQAIVPDVGNIIYGSLRDFEGNAIDVGVAAEVVMYRMQNDEKVVIARSPIVDVDSSDGGAFVNFILRPVLDDGLAGRFSQNSGRPDESVGIYVLQNGVEFAVSSANPTCEPVSDDVPALGVRGAVQRVDLRYIDDLDLDCIADSWENLWFGTTEFDGSENFDGDEFTNLEEFMNGTNPLFTDIPPAPAPPPGFAVFDVSVDSVSMNWPEIEGMESELEWSSNLLDFELVPTNRMSNIDGGKKVDTSARARTFFRVKYSDES